MTDMFGQVFTWLAAIVIGFFLLALAVIWLTFGTAGGDGIGWAFLFSFILGSPIVLLAGWLLLVAAAFMVSTRARRDWTVLPDGTRFRRGSAPAAHGSAAPKTSTVTSDSFADRLARLEQSKAAVRPPVTPRKMSQSRIQIDAALARKINKVLQIAAWVILGLLFAAALYDLTRFWSVISSGLPLSIYVGSIATSFFGNMISASVVPILLWIGSNLALIYSAEE